MVVIMVFAILAVASIYFYGVHRKRSKMTAANINFRSRSEILSPVSIRSIPSTLGSKNVSQLPQKSMVTEKEVSKHNSVASHSPVSIKSMPSTLGIKKVYQLPQKSMATEKEKVVSRSPVSIQSMPSTLGVKTYLN